MKRELRKKERNTHVCELCKREILPDLEPDPVHIKQKGVRSCGYIKIVIMRRTSE